jgi:hypothetical protein
MLKHRRKRLTPLPETSRGDRSRCGGGIEEQFRAPVLNIAGVADANIFFTGKLETN